MYVYIYLLCLIVTLVGMTYTMYLNKKYEVLVPTYIHLYVHRKCYLPAYQDFYLDEFLTAGLGKKYCMFNSKNIVSM